MEKIASTPIHQPTKPHMAKGIWSKKEILTAYAFILPSLFGFLVFSLVPTLSAFVISTFQWDIITKPEFIGIDNYTNLFRDPQFWHGLKLTVLYILYNIPIETVLAIILAIAMKQKLKGIGVFRTIYVMPWITTPVAVALVWKWLLDPTFGIFSYLLTLVGIPASSILSEVWFALPSIAIINIWQWTGYQMVLFLAGIQGIPKQLYEAADIDGATGWNKTWHITLPLLKPTTMFVLITSIIGSFQIFDTVFMMTQGGPGDATRVYYFYLYENAFKFFKMGYASAMAVVLFIILMILTILQFLYFRNQITYDLSS